MRVRLYPYKDSSVSARKLARAMGILRIKHENSRFRSRTNDTIINWGNSLLPEEFDYTSTIINHPDSVYIATNKWFTFQEIELENVPIPEYTTEVTKAQTWVDEGHRVYGRKTLTGHSGVGIRIFDSETICTPDYCPLYTKNTKAKAEYRVHVMKDQIIDFQQKKRKEGYEDGISGIRNHSNGWIFARNNVVLPESVKDASIKAVNCLGLDFGACDVGFRERDNMAFIYEVNTAPGLHGTTLQIYADRLKEFYLC